VLEGFSLTEIIIHMLEKPILCEPVLIEGLPGIGFVANIAALHLINELRATKFCEIHASSFQDVALCVEDGSVRSPVNELYYCRPSGGSRDLMVLYGNTQALTTYGQYVLCGKILDLAKGLGCRLVACMGGLKREQVSSFPKVYGTATHREMLNEILDYGVNIIQGKVVGAAGLLVGLAKLKGMRGFCLLAETLGIYPDAIAAQALLEVLCKILHLKIDLTRLEVAANETRKILELYGLPRYQSKPDFPGFV
jgi:uncharacterized protein (TIGR00162 family)